MSVHFGLMEKFKMNKKSHNKSSNPTKTLSQKLLFVALRHRNFCANSAVGRTVFAV